MLRKAIAEERGFGDDIQTPVLAKIMLAERFIPEFYDQISRIAASESSGKVPLIAKVEERAKDGGAKVKTDDTGEIDPWLKSEAVRDWAAIAPSLASLDLRPYVFVARDKRSFFAGVTTGDHLEILTERLTGAALAIRQAEGDIGKLNLSEVEQVFDALRGRILGVENLATAPPGVAGLALLVRKQPAMQRKLLDFLKDIPAEKAGAWAATSWSSCFVAPNLKSEFEAIRDSWSDSANPRLKAAVAAARKLGKGRG